MNEETYFSETAESMHAGAVEWEERREIAKEMNDEKCDECENSLPVDTLFDLSVTHGTKLCKRCYCEMFPQAWQ